MDLEDLYMQIMAPRQRSAKKEGRDPSIIDYAGDIIFSGLNFTPSGPFKVLGVKALGAIAPKVKFLLKAPKITKHIAAAATQPVLESTYDYSVGDSKELKDNAFTNALLGSATGFGIGRLSEKILPDNVGKNLEDLAVLRSTKDGDVYNESLRKIAGFNKRGYLKGIKSYNLEDYPNVYELAKLTEKFRENAKIDPELLHIYNSNPSAYRNAGIIPEDIANTHINFDDEVQVFANKADEYGTTKELANSLNPDVNKYTNDYGEILSDSDLGNSYAALYGKSPLDEHGNPTDEFIEFLEDGWRNYIDIQPSTVLSDAVNKYPDLYKDMAKRFIDYPFEYTTKDLVKQGAKSGLSNSGMRSSRNNKK